MSKEAWVLVGVIIGALFTLANTHLADKRSVARELRATRHTVYSTVLAAAFEYTAVSARLFRDSNNEARRAEQTEAFLKLVPTFESARLLCDNQDVEDAVVALLKACGEYGDAARNADELSNAEYQNARERFTRAAREELGRRRHRSELRVVVTGTPSRRRGSSRTP